MIVSVISSYATVDIASLNNTRITTKHVSLV